MGRTTEMMERAVALLGEIGENERVIITGAHSRWLHELEREFKRAGLVDIVFMSPLQIMEGKLRGMTGVLLIDDFWDMTYKEQEAVLGEQRILEARRR